MNEARLHRRTPSDRVRSGLSHAAIPGSGPRQPRGRESPGVGGDLAYALADRILYRDGLILVLDKPAGVAVHDGPGDGPDLESGFAALRFGLPRPPALAHRLDRDTSGCLVLGRHKQALRRLGTLFAEGKVEKLYWAVVAGRPARNVGRIATGLTKLSRGSGWRMVVDPQGRLAITDYRVLGTAGRRTWLELRPRTGRTHQIRAHCAALGCPVVGDPVYGGPVSGPLLLHARTIVLPLYPSRPPILVSAPLPPHIEAALAGFGCDPGKAEREEPMAGRSLPQGVLT